MNTTAQTIKPSPTVKLSDGTDGIRCCINVTPGAKTTSEPVIDFVASDATLDRAGELILPEGWLLDNYRRNPVFQNSHKYGDILFTIGKTEIIEVRYARPGNYYYLFQRVRFAIDANPFAKIAYDLYRGKFLNAVSVGFRPIKWIEGQKALPARKIYISQELIEVSAVSIPANYNALQLAMKRGFVERQDIEQCAELLEQILKTFNATPPAETLEASREKPNFCGSTADARADAGATGASIKRAQELRILARLSALRRSIVKLNAQKL